MKLFGKKDKSSGVSVPPELQQYYQVPAQPIAKRSVPVILILTIVLVAAAIIGGGVWLAFRSDQSDKSSSAKTSQSTTKTTKKENPAPKPSSPKPNPNLNTKPIAQPSVQ